MAGGEREEAFARLSARNHRWAPRGRWQRGGKVHFHCHLRAAAVRGGLIHRAEYQPKAP